MLGWFPLLGDYTFMLIHVVMWMVLETSASYILPVMHGDRAMELMSCGFVA